jgi:hypothetical protein
MQGSAPVVGRVVVVGAIAVTAALSVVLGASQGIAWDAAAAREAAIDRDTMGGVPGLGKAIDQFVAAAILAFGGLVLAVPAAAIVGLSRLPRRGTAFTALIVVMTLALLLGFALGSGSGDGSLIGLSLVVLVTVTVGALVGFGIGSLTRRDDGQVMTEDQRPAAPPPSPDPETPAGPSRWRRP